MAIQPGYKYLFAGWFRNAEAGWGQVDVLLIYQQAGKNRQIVIGRADCNKDIWTQLSKEFVVPEPAERSGLQLAIKTAWGRIAFLVDDLELRPALQIYLDRPTLSREPGVVLRMGPHTEKRNNLRVHVDVFNHQNKIVKQLDQPLDVSIRPALPAGFYRAVASTQDLDTQRFAAEKVYYVGSLAQLTHELENQSNAVLASETPARFKATAGRENQLYLELENINTLLIHTEKSPLDPRQQLKMSINAKVFITMHAPLPDSIYVTEENGNWSATASRPNRPSSALHTPGGVHNLYHSEPLLIVYGTGGDEAARPALAQAAIAASKSVNPTWVGDEGDIKDGVANHQLLYGHLKTKPDTAVTEADLKKPHLVLIGKAEENQIIRLSHQKGFAEKGLPLRFYPAADEKIEPERIYQVALSAVYFQIQQLINLQNHVPDSFEILDITSFEAMQQTLF